MGIPILLELQKPDLLLVVVSDLKILWTLGAAVLAVIVAFTTTAVIKRKKLIPAGLRKVKSVISLPSYYSFADDDDDSDEENEDEDEDDEDSEDEEEEYSSSEEEEAEWKDDGELDGQDLDWEDDSVVKLWEFDTSRGSISLFDSNRNEITRSFQPKSVEISAVHVSTPASVLAAEIDGEGHVAVKVWDARTAGGAPDASASATWRPERRVVGLMGKGEKVYVGDDVGKLTVVDLRNVRSTLGEIRRWSDGVMTAGERNAAMWLTLFPETG